MWRNSKFRETGNLKHFFRNELDKACFAHDAGYSDSKDLAKRTISNNILKEKAYEVAIPRDFEILGWCPAGPVLPQGEKVPL